MGYGKPGPHSCTVLCPCRYKNNTAQPGCQASCWIAHAHNASKGSVYVHNKVALSWLLSCASGSSHLLRCPLTAAETLQNGMLTCWLQLLAALWHWLPHSAEPTD